MVRTRPRDHFDITDEQLPWEGDDLPLDDAADESYAPFVAPAPSRRLRLQHGVLVAAALLVVAVAVRVAGGRDQEQPRTAAVSTVATQTTAQRPVVTSAPSAPKPKPARRRVVAPKAKPRKPRASKPRRAAKPRRSRPTAPAAAPPTAVAAAPAPAPVATAAAAPSAASAPAQEFGFER